MMIDFINSTADVVKLSDSEKVKITDYERIAQSQMVENPKLTTQEPELIKMYEDERYHLLDLKLLNALWDKDIATPNSNALIKITKDGETNYFIENDVESDQADYISLYTLLHKLITFVKIHGDDYENNIKLTKITNWILEEIHATLIRYQISLLMVLRKDDKLDATLNEHGITDYDRFKYYKEFQNCNSVQEAARNDIKHLDESREFLTSEIKNYLEKFGDSSKRGLKLTKNIYDAVDLLYKAYSCAFVKISDMIDKIDILRKELVKITKDRMSPDNLESIDKKPQIL